MTPPTPDRETPRPRFSTEQRTPAGWAIHDNRQPSARIATVTNVFDAKALVELLNDLTSALPVAAQDGARSAGPSLPYEVTDAEAESFLLAHNTGSHNDQYGGTPRTEWLFSREAVKEGLTAFLASRLASPASPPPSEAGIADYNEVTDEEVTEAMRIAYFITPEGEGTERQLVQAVIAHMKCRLGAASPPIAAGASTTDVVFLRDLADDIEAHSAILHPSRVFGLRVIATRLEAALASRPTASAPSALIADIEHAVRYYESIERWARAERLAEHARSLRASASPPRSEDTEELWKCGRCGKHQALRPQITDCRCGGVFQRVAAPLRGAEEPTEPVPTREQTDAAITRYGNACVAVERDGTDANRRELAGAAAALMALFGEFRHRLLDRVAARRAEVLRLEREEKAPLLASPPTSAPPRKWRKKPVVIEARQLGQDYDEDCDIIRWCGGKAVGEERGPNALCVIPTLEGEHVASSGDWVIRGVKGEFYPFKPDIFAATYEPADATLVSYGEREARGEEPAQLANQCCRVTLEDHRVTVHLLVDNAVDLVLTQNRALRFRNADTPLTVADATGSEDTIAGLRLRVDSDCPPDVVRVYQRGVLVHEIRLDGGAELRAARRADEGRDTGVSAPPPSEEGTQR